jgi:DNA-binding winged helix-turn-helix (wHTH) protein
MRIRFGDFTFDPGTRQITRGRDALHLSPKAFDLLSLLVERRPAVVEKSVIRQHLWPDTHVVEANVGNLVSEIRTVLADDSLRSPIVRTVHGVGYAFAGEAVAAHASQAAADAGADGRCWVVWNQRAIVLQESDNAIGRDPACAVWVDAPGVSRRHARIHIRDEGAERRAVLEDLNSTNGTFLRGSRVQRAEPLEDGDRIRIGDATITFRAWKDAGGSTKRVRRAKS